MPAAAIALIVIGLAAIVIAGVALEHLRHPQQANEWRYIPNWRPERLSRLHVIDADLEGLDELAIRTILAEVRWPREA